MRKSDQTSLLFGNHNCAQTIFSLFAPDLGLDTQTALKISAGFGSGMNCGETCGAVTGAYMVIGLKSGHTSSVPEEKERTKHLIQQFNSAFLEEHASLKCKNLLGFDVSDPAQRELARDAGVFDRCPRFLQTAARILEEKL
jgi:C_GCAxxG_C_C family probable redox protein